MLETSSLARLARTTACVLAVFAVAACAPDAIRPPTAPPDDAAFTVVPVAVGGGGVDAPSALDFPTYDGSREVVHPDVLRVPARLGGGLWSVVTPYPNSQSRFENPSLFTSEAGATWTPPLGVSNPLANTGRGYLSDPDLLYDPSRNELRLYFREVVMAGRRHVADNVYYMTSPDGVRWSPKAAATVDRGRYVVSPSVVRDAGGAWRMWAVDAGAKGCDAGDAKIVLRRSADGARWGAASPVSFAQAGYVPWHLDVVWVPERQQYWALVAAYPRGTACTATSLFLATSVDGVRWTTFASPVLARGAVPQFSANVYRSSLLFESDATVTLWMSGASVVVPGRKGRDGKTSPPTLRWTAAVARSTATALLARANRPPSALSARRVPAAVVDPGNDIP